MTVVLIALIAMIFAGARYAQNGSFHKDYLSKESTCAVNGIFVFLVFLRHFKQYVELNDTTDLLFSRFDGYLNQLIVVSFLFFSGYGMMCSISKKGEAYTKSLFKNHFLKLLLHFDICVALFVLTNFAVGSQFSLKDTLLAFTSWTSIGNSNWYITAVLAMYLVIIVSFLLFGKSKPVALVCVTVLTMAFVYLNIRLDRPMFTYDTVIVFPLGMWYAYFKPTIDKIVMKNNIAYYSCAAIAISVFVLVFSYRFRGVEQYAIWACAFAAILVLAMMKIKITNPFFNFLGSHVFSIYILQRIPMIIMRKTGLNSHPFNMFIMSFAITVAMALIFDFLMGKLDALLFERKKKLRPSALEG